MTEYAIKDNEKCLLNFRSIIFILMILFFCQFFVFFDRAFASYTGVGSIDESALTTDVVAIEKNEILEEAFERAWKSGQDKVLSEFLKIIFDQTKVNFPKDLKEIIVSEVQEKGLKGNVLELGKDAAIGWIVDIVADSAMMHFLSIPHDSGKIEKIKAIGLASFVWFSIKEIPIIYSSGANPVALAAGQALLLTEVADKVRDANLERIRETADAPKSKINEVIFAAYQKYRKGLVSANPGISAQAAAALSSEIDRFIMTLQSEESRTEAIHARNVYFSNLSDSIGAYRSSNPIGQSDIITSYLALTFSQKIAAVSKDQKLAYSPLNISDTEFFLLKEIEAQNNPLNFVPIGVLYTRWYDHIDDQPNIDPVLDVNTDATDEDNAEVVTEISVPSTDPETTPTTTPVTTPTTDPEPVYAGTFRGYIAGTVGAGSLFTHTATTQNDGSVQLSTGSNTFVTTGGDVSITTSYHLLDYTHSSMGSWNSSDVTGSLSVYPGSSLQSGHWVMGDVTPPSYFDGHLGGATYTGQLAGTTFGGTSVGGIINLTADFQNQTIIGELGFTHNGTPWVNATTSLMSLIDASDHTTFDGTFNMSEGASGSLSGMFYGPEAQELGGQWAIWDVPDAIGGADGVLLAEQGAYTTVPAIPASVPSGSPVYVGRAVEFTSSCGGPLGCGGLGGTQTFTIGSLVDVQTLTDGTSAPVSGYNQIQNSGTLGNTRYVSLNDTTSGDYSYTDWGTWSRPPNGTDGSPDTAITDTEYWVLGQATLPQDMPKFGSATFNGDMRGYYRTSTFSALHGARSYGHSLTGDIQLNANFSSNTIDGNYTLRRADGTVYSAGNINPANYASGPNSVGFNSTFNNGGSNYGAIDGTFYGPSAEEIGGGWELTNAKGVYRAKR